MQFRDHLLAQAKLRFSAKHAFTEILKEIGKIEKEDIEAVRQALRQQFNNIDERVIDNAVEQALLAIIIELKGGGGEEASRGV